MYYCVLLCVTVSYCVLLCLTVCYCVLLCATVCYCVLLCLTVCYCVLLCVNVCYCVLLCVTVSYCVLLCLTVSYCPSVPLPTLAIFPELCTLLTDSGDIPCMFHDVLYHFSGVQMHYHLNQNKCITAIAASLFTLEYKLVTHTLTLTYHSGTWRKDRPITKTILMVFLCPAHFQHC